VKRNSKATLFLILSGVVFLLGCGGAYVLYGEYSSKEAEAAKLRKDTKDFKQLETELQTIIDENKDNMVKLAHLEKGVPEMAYVPTMLKELEAFGKKNGIQVLGVRPVPQAQSNDPKKKPKAKPYNELTIEIKGRGAYRSAMSFVTGLKTFPKIVAARMVSLAPKNDQKAGEAAARTLEMTVELRAYLFKPQKGEKLEVPALDKTKPSKEPMTPAAPAGNAKATAMLSGGRNEG
jgi:Tfp pilus assembly protein PilO